MTRSARNSRFVDGAGFCDDQMYCGYCTLVVGLLGGVGEREAERKDQWNTSFFFLPPLMAWRLAVLLGIRPLN